MSERLGQRGVRLGNKLRHMRSRLADLYDEAREVYTQDPSRPGALSVQMTISDAIDDLDRAIRASPTEEVPDA